MVLGVMLTSLTLQVLLLKTSIFTGFSALDLRISFSVSLSWSSLVFSIEMMKSKKGSNPALYPGEFS